MLKMSKNVVALSKEEIRLDVPEELKELMIEVSVANDCQDKAINSFFRAKRAIYYGKVLYKARDKFWKLAKQLHPLVKNQDYDWWYDYKTEQIIGKK
jgi:hypothetical protein